MWVCPVCQKRVRILFYPVELYCVQLLDKEFEAGHRFALPRPFDRAPFDRAQGRPAKQFACAACHRVGHFKLSRSWDCWNQLVTRLSDGLLYGREVERPKNFPLGVGDAYRLRVMPSPRRDYIRERLLEGISFERIADEMKIKPVSVYFAARIIYRQVGVRTLREFLAKHGRDVTVRKRELVVERLKLGETNIQIAAATGLTVIAVSNHVCALYRRWGVKGPRSREALVEAVRKTSASGGAGTGQRRSEAAAAE